MKALAYWAHHHVWSARFLIALSYILFNGIAFLLGQVLGAEGVVLPFYWWYVVALLSAVAFVIYPTVKTGRNFWQRKWLDGALLAGAFLFIALAGNSPQTAIPNGFAAYASTTTASATARQPIMAKKEIKNFFKSIFFKAKKAYKKLSKPGRMGWVLLAIFIAVALCILLAGLGCGISCNGAETVGILLIVLGWAAIAFLLVRIIKRISGGPKQLAAPPPAESTSGTYTF